MLTKNPKVIIKREIKRTDKSPFMKLETLEERLKNVGGKKFTKNSERWAIGYCIDAEYQTDSSNDRLVNYIRFVIGGQKTIDAIRRYKKIKKEIIRPGFEEEYFASGGIL